MSVVRGLLLSAVASVALVAGCDLGDVTTGGGTTDAMGGDEAQAMMLFTSNVTPNVARCTTPGCHGDDSALGPKLASYASFKALMPMRYMTKPASSNILILKAGMLGGGTLHQQIQYLNATEQTAVSAFIDALP